MSSERYNFLVGEITDLANLFLDFEPNPTGEYAKPELVKAAAYTVLAHSETETYFEEILRDLIAAAEHLWKSEQRACRTLISMCGFATEKGTLPKQKPSVDIWQEPIFNGISRARGMITNNNGIKAQNIIPLLALVGFDVRSLEDDLLTQLDAFGSMRGRHAHNTSSANLGQVFDPFDRKQKIEGLLASIQIFDAAFQTFRDAQFEAGGNVHSGTEPLIVRIKRFLGL